MKPRACEIVLHVSRQLYGQISNSKFLTLEISFSPRRRKLEMLERILFRLSSLVLSRSNAHCVGQGGKIRADFKLPRSRQSPKISRRTKEKAIYVPASESGTRLVCVHLKIESRIPRGQSSATLPFILSFFFFS